MSNAPKYRSFLPWKNQPRAAGVLVPGPDDRSGAVYLHDPLLQLAAETAIVTQRPLLIRGEPGSGKSSFAPFAARNLGWRYYELTVTGRTEARDLLWRFDALARLRDANVHDSDMSIEPRRYVTPGVLWWAFNRKEAVKLSAERRALIAKSAADAAHGDEPFAEINATRDPERAVVLLDEIDKADPNVPNDLLEVLGLNRFTVDELALPVRREIPAPAPDPISPDYFGSLLIIVTTNQERDLPAAFLRRCVVYTIQEPKKEEEQIARLKAIAELHMIAWIRQHPQGGDLSGRVAAKCCQLRQESRRRMWRGPSTAEFLDALRVAFWLKIEPDNDLWEQVERGVLFKEEGAAAET
jgi:MoxR-like ATPase